MRQIQDLMGYYKSLLVMLSFFLVGAIVIRFNVFGLNYGNDSTLIVAMILGFVGFVFNIISVTRFPVLTHYKMANLIPGYHQQLGKQLRITMLLPLLPMFLLLPDFSLMLSAMGLLLLINLIALFSMYKPLFMLVLGAIYAVVMIFLTMFKQVFTEEVLTIVLPGLLPAMLIVMTQLVNYLPNIKISKRQLEVMKNSSDMQNKVMYGILAQDKKARLANPVQEWIAQFNIRFIARGLAKKAVSKQQLLNMALFTKTSMGPFNYLMIITFATLAVTIAAILGLKGNTPFMMGMTYGMVGAFFMASTMVFANIAMSKKPYISQLGLSPLFENRQSLRRSFAFAVLLKVAYASLAVIAILIPLNAVIGEISGKIMMFNIVLTFGCFGLAAGVILIVLHGAKQIHWGFNFVMIAILLVLCLGLGLSAVSELVPEKTLRAVYLSSVLGAAIASLVIGLNQWFNKEPTWEGSNVLGVKG